MARSTHRLSWRKVETVKKRGKLADGGGLYLQVGPQASKSWLFRFVSPTEPHPETGEPWERWMGLGALASLPLAEARDVAQECRSVLREGLDPIEHREAQRRTLKAARKNTKSFRYCAEQFITDQGDGWKNAKHRQQWENTLATYAYPEVGDLPVSEITTDHVARIIRPIWKAKTETASRLRGRIERVLGWAKHKGYREGENPAAWKDNLEHELPPRGKVQNITHHAALPYADIGEFMVALRTQEALSARALEFLILTAGRTGEVIGARWDEVDTDNRLWTIPARRMKAEVDHNVPLSDDALAVVKSLLVVDDNPHMFAGQRKGRPLSNMALLMLLKRMGHGDVTAHGFRSSFRDWAAEHTSFPRLVPELCLAHGPKDKVEAAYLRAEMLPKRRELLDAWAGYCALVPGDQDNVTPIRGRTA